MNVMVNGEAKQVTAKTVAQLLAELGLADRPVAVERNRKVVSRRDYGRTALEPSDVIELVTLVGGG